MSTATGEKGGLSAKGHRSEVSNGVEQGVCSVGFLGLARNLVDGCVQSTLLHCQVQGQADGSGVLKSESNHSKIILMILSEYRGRAKTAGSKSKFIIHVRRLPNLHIFKIINLLAR